MSKEHPKSGDGGEVGKPPPPKKSRTATPPGLTSLLTPNLSSNPPFAVGIGASNPPGPVNFVGGTNLTISNGRVISNNPKIANPLAIHATNDLSKVTFAAATTSGAMTSGAPTVQFLTPASVLRMGGGVATFSVPVQGSQPSVIMQNPTASFLVPMATSTSANLTQQQILRLSQTSVTAVGPSTDTPLANQPPSKSKKTKLQHVSLLKNSKGIRPAQDFLKAMNVRPAKWRSDKGPIKIAPALPKDTPNITLTEHGKFTPVIFAPVAKTASSIQSPITATSSMAVCSSSISNPTPCPTSNIAPGTVSPCVGIPLSAIKFSTLAPFMPTTLQNAAIINMNNNAKNTTTLNSDNTNNTIKNLNKSNSSGSITNTTLTPSSSVTTTTIDHTNDTNNNTGAVNITDKAVDGGNFPGKQLIIPEPGQLQISFDLKTGRVEKNTLGDVPKHHDTQGKPDGSKNESTVNADELSGMVWKCGVGYLTGSNLKFRMNEFDMLEVIPDTVIDSLPVTSVAEAVVRRDMYDDVGRLTPEDLSLKPTPKLMTGEPCKRNCDDISLECSEKLTDDSQVIDDDNPDRLMIVDTDTEQNAHMLENDNLDIPVVLGTIGVKNAKTGRPKSVNKPLVAPKDTGVVADKLITPGPSVEQNTINVLTNKSNITVSTDNSDTTAVTNNKSNGVLAASNNDQIHTSSNVASDLMPDNAKFIPVISSNKTESETAIASDSNTSDIDSDNSGDAAVSSNPNTQSGVNQPKSSVGVPLLLPGRLRRLVPVYQKEIPSHTSEVTNEKSIKRMLNSTIKEIEYLIKTDEQAELEKVDSKTESNEQKPDTGMSDMSGDVRIRVPKTDPTDDNETGTVNKAGMDNVLVTKKDRDSVDITDSEKTTLTNKRKTANVRKSEPGMVVDELTDPGMEEDASDSCTEEERMPQILEKINKKTLMVKDILKKRKKKSSISAKRHHGFSWSDYLRREKAVGAPPKVFKQPFPLVRNALKTGMKLEGVGPHNQSHYSVLTVAETRGYRVRLHYDDESEGQDFWVNADHPYLFPVGWCERNKKMLQPPLTYDGATFNWSNYLRDKPAQIVQKNQLSQNSTPVGASPFRAGQKIEAVDRKNSTLTCVATVADTIGDRLLVHFDGWESSYDYWCDVTSPYIHPVGWCQANGRLLAQPGDWNDEFYWDTYLKKCRASAAPSKSFRLREPIALKEGMKVEVVDKRNPILIRVATIVSTLDYRVKIHFDGWDSVYDYWLDDDHPDIHPPDWCMRTSHPLMVPLSPEDIVVDPGEPGCPTPGCKGIGHIKGAKFTGHHSAFGCPYSLMNLQRENESTTAEVHNDDLGSPGSRDQPSALVTPPPPRDPPRIKQHGSDENKKPPRTKAKKSPTQVEADDHTFPLHDDANNTDPAFMSRSKRGRKTKSFLHWREKKEKEEKDKEIQRQMHLGIHQSVFLSTVSPTELPTTLPYGWEQHTKLLPGINRYDGSDVSAWNTEQVALFIKTLLGSKEYAQRFREQQIDGEAFLLLNQNDLISILDFKLGPAVKIYNTVVMFKTSSDV